MRSTGTWLVHVPYEGSATPKEALLEGDAQLMDRGRGRPRSCRQAAFAQALAAPDRRVCEGSSPNSAW